VIYLVSNTIDISGMEGVQKMSVDDSIKLVSSWPIVMFDTETSGLDPHCCTLTSMQFGYKNFKTGVHNEIVIDCKSIDPKLYKDCIENAYLLGQNLKFDLQFLYNYGIVPRKIYDTMICEQVLYLGYNKKQVKMSLAAIAQRYLGVNLDKSFQKQIARRGLTRQGIIYSANDVTLLQDIRKAQMLVAEARNCKKAFIVENRAVPAIAYLEWCGVHLDETRWRAKMEKDNVVLTKSLDKLNDYVMNHTLLKDKFKSSYTQLDLFQAMDTTMPTCSVNWNSPVQAIPVFKELGFNTKVFDKKNKVWRDSIEEKAIKNQKGIDDKFLEMYLNFKGNVKTTTSYGQNFLNLVNPDTKRLHTKFNQIGTVTSRMSSGGDGTNRDLAIKKELKASDVTFVNMQNLPARGEEGKIARACFTSMPGNVFISCDFSAEESRVQADVWNEKSLLDSFNNGIDTHNVYAKLCFPEELKDVDVKDVKKVRPDLRQAAKSCEFAVGYGSDGSAVAEDLGIPKEKAKEMVSTILQGMPGMRAFKKKTVRFLKGNGYMVINPITGHRVYWPQWSEWKAVEDTLDRQFWNEYVAVHKGTGDAIDRKITKRKEDTKCDDWFHKNALNYPIQGGSAIVLKQAAADLFDWVVSHGYFGKILFCVFVHDEICVECPEDISKDFTKTLESIMENAAGLYYKKLKIPAEAEAASYWKH